MSTHFDIIVVGGGHAGIEAAWAASNMGACVALITMDWQAIGRMSCNPAIGGLGKGQIVREIDALGGLMGLATDRAGIQFRMLNRSKGPAVWAPRAQADRDLYPRAVQSLLLETPNLTIVEGAVADITTKTIVDPADSNAASTASKRVSGVTLKDGRQFSCDALILTTGTFLRGLMHCGSQQTEGGRVGEAAAQSLSGSLLKLGFELGRLKTGTPPRIHRDSIDYDVCTVQPGDEFPTPFSTMTDCITQPQLCCWVTWTNEKAHELIRNNLHRAPMYSGQIDSTGPRYCPSIEDKVVRFAEKPRHQIFLEPEGYDNERVYCNGISTSLPKEIQDEFVRLTPGLENARIVQHGYAVEYDFVPTHQTRFSLETKLVDGLYLAGQINGTSGYEEAAGQGLVAGVNAARRLRGEPTVVFRRDQAYIGVMVDDLITKPPTEPYRMFTSRAEYRLALRADNADQRLTPLGRDLGLVDDARWSRYERKRKAMAAAKLCCQGVSVDGTTMSAWLRRPEASADKMAALIQKRNSQLFCIDTLEQMLIEAKYSGYIERQSQQIDRFRRLESMAIPADVLYTAFASLRLEARERLTAVKPLTLGQASRITGITPADITALWIALTAHKKPGKNPRQ